jgi:hypothetical protein
MIPVPGILQDLQPHTLEHLPLVSIFIVLSPKMRDFLLKVAVLIYGELIMGPERIIKSKVAVLFIGVVGVIEPCQIAHHVNAKFAVERILSLIEGTHSHSYLHTHSKHYKASETHPLKYLSQKFKKSGPFILSFSSTFSATSILSLILSISLTVPSFFLILP